MDGPPVAEAKSRRERWSASIETQRERLLSFGSLSEVVPAPSSLDEDWHSFIARLSRPEMVLQCLVLANASSVSIVRDELPLLYRALRRTTVARAVISRDGVTGSPLWSPTIRARAAGGGDDGIFVVARTARSADVPENRGLVSCLGYLDTLVGALANGVGGEERLPKPLQAVGSEARLGLRLPSLRDLPREPLLSVRSQRAMARSRHGALERIANLSLKLRDIEDAASGDLAASLATAGWFAPLSDDSLFELFVLSSTIQHIVSKWGEPRRLSPIRMGEVIASWDLPDDVSIRVHFDSTPTEVRRTSRYLRLSRQHPGIFNASARRPDITIEVVRKKVSRFTIIEVKNPAEDSDNYRRLSLYKCFGYLHDFAEVLDLDDGEDICFLVFPDKIGSPPSGGEQVAVVSGDYGTGFKDRLLKRIKHTIAGVGEETPSP
jgi:hypothetical protein